MGGSGLGKRKRVPSQKNAGIERTNPGFEAATDEDFEGDGISLKNATPDKRPSQHKFTFRETYINYAAAAWTDVADPKTLDLSLHLADIDHKSPKDSATLIDDPSWIAHTVQCCEKTCKRKSRTIYLDASHKARLAKSTPHKELRKPPVCHITPWAALKAHVDEVVTPILFSQKKVLSSEFIRFYCWFGDNLQPGHNGCNAAGSAAPTPKQIKAAKAIYEAALDAYSGKAPAIRDIP